MNKKIADFAAAHGFYCDKKRACGLYNGYQVSIRFDSTTAFVGFHVNLGEKTNAVLSWLTITKKKDFRIANVITDSSGFYCIFLAWTAGGSLKKAENLLREITDYMKATGVPCEGCPYCGRPMEKPALVEDQSVLFYAHDECFNNKYMQVAAAESAESAAPNHYLNGFAGALIGALAGCAVFAILFAIGYLASLSSLVGALLASALYSKFGGKNNKVKIVIVTAVTFVLIIITFFVCNIVYVDHLMAENHLYGSATQMFFRLIRMDAEVKRAVIGDLLMTVLFTVIGIVVNVVAMVRQQKKTSSTMKKY